jgi:hypothetical protein
MRMAETAQSDETRLEVERLRALGYQVIGPGPMTQGQTSPTPDAADPMPGMHVQIRHGSRFVEGFGATADEALRDAAVKLEGYDPTGSVVAPAEGGPRGPVA